MIHCSWRGLGVRNAPGLFLPLLAALAVGCAEAGRGSGGEGLQAETVTVGDTTIVRTLAGSDWGAAELVPERRIGALDGADHEILGQVSGLAVGRDGDILIYDNQVPALRRYAADGRYRGTLGRKGSGPGEYANSDGGLAVLADGRIILRDPGNARITVYDPDGAYFASWPIRGGSFTTNPLFPATDGGFYNPVWGRGQPMRLARHAADGTPVDTLPLPARRVEEATVTAQTQGASQTWMVPFTESALWTFHPDGHFLSATNQRYEIDLLAHDGRVLRIAKSAEPVPVSREERAAQEERVTRAMRRLVPDWRWNGPPIPSVKPLLRALYAGDDGRIWVQLYQPGERVPDAESEPAPDGGAALPRFREPVVFDVFEKDGRYRGRVIAPAEFSTSPRPVFRDRHVWATESDDLGVQYIVRYRIQWSAGPTGDP